MGGIRIDLRKSTGACVVSLALRCVGSNRASAEEASTPAVSFAERAFQQGLAALKAGDRKEAIRHFDEAVNDTPDFANAWYDLGELQAATGDLQAAKITLERYLELVPAGTRADAVKEILKHMELLKPSNLGSKQSNYLDQMNEDERPRWSTPPRLLKVCLVPCEQDLPGYKAEFDAEVIAALKAWEKASDGLIAFEFSENAMASDIAIGWTNNPNVVESPGETGKCNLILGQGTMNIRKALILIRPFPNPEPMTAVQAWNVSLHEIGHALGIYGHSSDPTDVMYFFSLPDNFRHKLSARDVNTLKALYAASPIRLIAPHP